jgi:hypothetical protein
LGLAPSSLGLAPPLASPPLAALVTPRQQCSLSTPNEDRSLRSPFLFMFNHGRKNGRAGFRHAAISSLRKGQIRSDGNGRRTSGGHRGTRADARRRPAERP